MRVKRSRNLVQLFEGKQVLIHNDHEQLNNIKGNQLPVTFKSKQWDI